MISKILAQEMTKEDVDEHEIKLSQHTTTVPRKFSLDPVVVEVIRQYDGVSKMLVSNEKTTSCQGQRDWR